MSEDTVPEILNGASSTSTEPESTRAKDGNHFSILKQNIVFFRKHHTDKIQVLDSLI